MTDNTKTLQLRSVAKASGEVQLPGSKSISNRVLLLAALAKGQTRIKGVLDSDDTRVMLNALEALGVNFQKENNNTVVVDGDPFLSQRPASADLYMGNAGTAIRPLTAVLAVLGGDFTLSGVSRMHERPIGDLVDALLDTGAQIDYLQNKGYPPLKIGEFKAADHHEIEVNGSVSSQFLTALLMAAPLLVAQTKQTLVIKVKGELISKPYILITLNLMKRFGVHVSADAWQRFEISPDAAYQSPGEILVEGDASSASYFLAAGLLGGGPVKLKGLNADSIQGDLEFSRFIQKFDAHISFGEDYVEVRRMGETSSKLPAFDEDFNLIPDAAMTAAVLALFADGTCRLRNIGSWRVKETDRIEAMHSELEKVGAQVKSGEDYIEITPPTEWKSATINTYDDHRMAMCFSLCAFGPVEQTICDPDCVGKTFPDYFAEFDTLTK